MKTLSRIKLTNLNKVELIENEMNLLLGGESCGCGEYESPTNPNDRNTNWNIGYYTSNGNYTSCASWGDSEWKTNFN